MTTTLEQSIQLATKAHEGVNMSEILLFKGSSTYKLEVINESLFKLVNLTYNKSNTKGILYSSKELLNFLNTIKIN